MSTDSPDAMIAVFEKRPYWGPELQRQFHETGVVVRECRSVRDLFPSIESIPSAMIVLDLEAGLDDCLDWLGNEVLHSPRSIPIIALGSATTVDLEWPLREAGVTAFISDIIQGNQLARLCRRQLGYSPPRSGGFQPPHSS